MFVRLFFQILVQLHVVKCWQCRLSHERTYRRPSPPWFRPRLRVEGDTAKAMAAYQDFFTLWKDADPDIPIFIAAKAEYAKLK
jgi:hypothetical protein